MPTVHYKLRTSRFSTHKLQQTDDISFHYISTKIAKSQPHPSNIIEYENLIFSFFVGLF